MSDGQARLPNERNSRIGAALIGAVLCLVAQAAYCVANPPPQPQPSWLPILSYRGVLDPAEGEVQATVLAAWHMPPHGSDAINANKIEITGPGGPKEYSWDHMVSGRCDVLDLDGDGTREFVFRGIHAAVVGYRAGQFIFRDYSKRGDLLLSNREIEMPDLDGDGRPEFVSYRGWSGEGPRPDPPPPDEPSVWKWSKDSGFLEAPALLPAYRRTIKR